MNCQQTSGNNQGTEGKKKVSVETEVDYPLGPAVTCLGGPKLRGRPCSQLALPCGWIPAAVPLGSGGVLESRLCWPPFWFHDCGEEVAK